MSELLSGKPALEMRRPKQDYVADPFLVLLDRRTFILAEEYLSDVGRGRIVSQEIGGDGRTVGACHAALETSYHVSFPTVVTDPKDSQSFYLLVEQASAGAVVLYRGSLEASDRSMRFAEHATLLEIPGIDPVLLYFGGWWYLFVTDGSYGNVDNNLSLYYSSSLAGPFRVHPASPIKSGLRGSRMAGGIVKEGSSLFRLGQDNRYRYGESIVVFEIVRLSTEEYEEREVNVVAPPRENGAILGIHTLNSSGNLLAVDKLVSRPGSPKPPLAGLAF